LYKQENIQNQFIAFKKVQKSQTEVDKKLKGLLKQDKEKNQIELLTCQQDFYEQMTKVQKQMKVIDSQMQMKSQISDVKTQFLENTSDKLGLDDIDFGAIA